MTVEAVAHDRRTHHDPVHPSPEQAWQLAAAIAGRPRVRVSRDGGRSYPAGCERPLTAALPGTPAAVLLFNHGAAAPCLAADFDVSRGGPGQVDADAAAFTALVEACGGRSFADVSPTGGRHVYVLWSRPRPITELRPLLRALCGLFPSLDPAPMLNPAAGCIRPPGARHRTGGHQELTTALSAARAAVAAPNGPGVWCALLEHLAPTLSDPDVPEASAPDDLTCPQAVSPGARLTARIEQVARTGNWDPARYASPSEARQAVVTATVAAGWVLADLAARVESGTWPGLAGMYARYSPRNRRKALAADWRKAHGWLGREKSARNSPTRGRTHTGGNPGGHNPQPLETPLDAAAEYRWIRAWWNATGAVERIRWTARAGLSKRLVLRALGAMAQRRGTRVVDVGRRSLALACGLDDSTVGAVLRALREEADPVLELLEPAAGERADRYALRIPDAGLHAAAWRRWQPGNITAIHPVFRELGPTAALVHETLTQDPAKRREITHDAALPPSTVDEALRTLAEHGLAENIPGQGWRCGPVPLDKLARTLGITELVEALSARYRVERAAWRALLDRITPRPRPMAVGHGPSGPIPWPERLAAPPPTDPDEHAYDRTLADLDTDPGHAIEREAIRLFTAAFGPITTDTIHADDPRYGTFAGPRSPGVQTA